VIASNSSILLQRRWTEEPALHSSICQLRLLLPQRYTRQHDSDDDDDEDDDDDDEDYGDDDDSDDSDDDNDDDGEALCSHSCSQPSSLSLFSASDKAIQFSWSIMAAMDAIQGTVSVLLTPPPLDHL